MLTVHNDASCLVAARAGSIAAGYHLIGNKNQKLFI